MIPDFEVVEAVFVHVVELLSDPEGVVQLDSKGTFKDNLIDCLID